MRQAAAPPSGNGLVAAIEANLAGHFAWFGRLPEAESHDGPELTWVLTRAHGPVPNGVYRTQVSRGAIADRIDHVVHVFASRGIRALRWVCGPGSEPADLAEQLSARGFVHLRDWIGMATTLKAADLGVTDPFGVDVEEVTNPAGLARWLEVYRASSEHPEAGPMFSRLFSDVGFGPDAPMRHYVGALDGEPSGRCTLAFAGGTAGIHWVATAPRARRRGVASALVLAALRAARARGYESAVLHSTAAAVQTYRRLGFEELCTLNVYERRLHPGREGGPLAR